MSDLSEKYAKKALWTLDEATALLLGLDPNIYNMSTIGSQSETNFLEEEHLNAQCFMDMRHYL